MNELKKREFRKNLLYESEIILSYRIEFLEMIGREFLLGKEAFNKEQIEQAKALQKYAEGELFEQAKQLYQYNKEHGYPTRKYEVIKEDRVSYFQGEWISLFSEQYLYTGGANGTSIRKFTKLEFKTSKANSFRTMVSKSALFFVTDFKRNKSTN